MTQHTADQATCKTFDTFEWRLDMVHKAELFQQTGKRTATPRQTDTRSSGCSHPAPQACCQQVLET